MKVFILIFLLVGLVASNPDEEERIESDVTPEFLDKLLAEKRYEEFNEIMGIPLSHLSQPNQVISAEDPSMNKELFEGDILLTTEQLEQARQGINFGRYPGSRWPGNPAQVAYSISSDFSQRDRNTIQSSITEWNNRVRCIKFVERRSESAFAHFFPGDGCYANLGRTRRQQPISLGRGCVVKGIVWHEMEHTIGITHEHNRNDRDNYVEVLWENIPDEWKSQYEKNDPNDFGLQQTYDYYSVMHYRMQAPGTNKPAFRIKQRNVDENRIGQRSDFSSIDLAKMEELYC